MTVCLMYFSLTEQALKSLPVSLHSFCCMDGTLSSLQTKLCPPKERAEIVVEDYTNEVAVRMSDAWELARRNVKRAQTSEKTRQASKTCQVPTWEECVHACRCPRLTEEVFQAILRSLSGEGSLRTRWCCAAD